jgi:phosphate-selective porin OprO/OprP
VGSDGWGAFEIGTRFSGLNIDSDTYTADAGKLATASVNSVQGAREYGVAANWYLNNNAKLSLNFENTHFKDVAGAAASTNRPDERALLVQAQIYY